MPHETHNDALTKRLLAVLASYGADPARWPVADRDTLLPHLAEAAAASEDARHIDRLLDLVPAPSLASGLEAKLMARIRTSAPAKFQLGWSAALPLAASLALGIYLGATGALDDLLPSLLTDDIAVMEDDGDSSGVTEATDYSEEQLS